MDAHGHTVCFPQVPASMPTRPLLEITSCYAKRAAGQLPHQGTEGPWRTCMEYRADHKMLREGPVEHDHLRFATSSPAEALEPALIG
jgi:hypothetical protein